MSVNPNSCCDSENLTCWLCLSASFPKSFLPICFIFRSAFFYLNPLSLGFSSCFSSNLPLIGMWLLLLSLSVAFLVTWSALTFWRAPVIRITKHWFLSLSFSDRPLTHTDAYFPAAFKDTMLPVSNTQLSQLTSTLLFTIWNFACGTVHINCNWQVNLRTMQKDYLQIMHQDDKTITI